jgi:ElaB/YqjD/DUF883 family membrane-anchored ribosome-binding protein
MGETTDEVTPVRDFNRSRGQAVSGEPAMRDRPDATEDGSPSASEIRSGIEETRSNLSATIGELQEKLDPSRIADQVKDQIREKATEAFDNAKHAVKEATIGKAEKIMSSVSEAVSDMSGRAGTAVSDSSSSVMQYVRENPIPLAFVGLGLGLLAMNKRRASSSVHSSGRASDPSFVDRASSVMGGVADSARGAATGVTDKARAAAGTLRDAASTGADTARQQVSQVSERVRGTFGENPMALGLAAVAAGALVGMSLPSTRVEGQYLGQTRDKLFDQAKSMAQEMVGKVQRVTEQAGETVKDAAQKEGLVAAG